MITVLFSGGLDSTVLAEMAHQAGRLHSLIHFSYGQPAAPQEYEAAERWARRRAVSLERIIPILHGMGDMRDEVGLPGPRVIPGRNLLLISMAANYAAAHGVEELWYGATRDDWDAYPDCRPEFVESVCALVSEDVGVQVKAPLLQMTKHEVVDTARLLGVDIESTWSCYRALDGKPCGTCNSCSSRAAAFSRTIEAGSCCEDVANQRLDPTTGEVDCVSCGADLSNMEGR